MRSRAVFTLCGWWGALAGASIGYASGACAAAGDARGAAFYGVAGGFCLGVSFAAFAVRGEDDAA